MKLDWLRIITEVNCSKQARVVSQVTDSGDADQDDRMDYGHIVMTKLLGL